MNSSGKLRGVTGDEAMARLGHLVGVGRTRCGWSRDQAAVVSGIGRQTWDDIEKGRARNYSDKTKQGITSSLGWTLESWDQVLGGGDPELAPTSSTTRLEQLEARFDRIEALLERLLSERPDPPTP